MTPFRTARYICRAFSGLEWIAESMGKSHGGRTCSYINERWCTDVTVLKKMCCPDLEVLFINFKPFYSLQEVCSFILESVYIPPQAHVKLALQKLANLIRETEQQHLDSVLIILGDFNKANLSRDVTCPTRDSNILDYCYTTIKYAYHSVPLSALGLSDRGLHGLKTEARPGPCLRLSDPTQPDPSGTVKFRARTRPEIPPPTQRIAKKKKRLHFPIACKETD